MRIEPAGRRDVLPMKAPEERVLPVVIQLALEAADASAHRLFLGRLAAERTSRALSPSLTGTRPVARVVQQQPRDLARALGRRDAAGHRSDGPDPMGSGASEAVGERGAERMADPVHRVEIDAVGGRHLLENVIEQGEIAQGLRGSPGSAQVKRPVRSVSAAGYT